MYVDIVISNAFNLNKKKILCEKVWRVMPYIQLEVPTALSQPELAANVWRVMPYIQLEVPTSLSQPELAAKDYP